MKAVIKEYGKKLYKHRRDIVETMGIGILLTAFFAIGVFLRGIVADRDMALWKSFVLTPEPEICALCGSGIPYHAPVLVNLSTGEAGEIRVYDPDPQHRYELAEKQSTGTFSFLHIAGAAGYRDTSNHICCVTLPEKVPPIDPGLFCRDCRALLADTDTEGYILADLYKRKQAAFPSMWRACYLQVRDKTMREKTCCFTGHRKIPPEEREEIANRLECIISTLYQQGVRWYEAGGALGFDYEKEMVM